ncbi:cation transporter [Rhodocaloribacter litoris]|uniref:heavy-metal-associated domain-containing protein n=1 Tax=Rhodocaloribacter litoris TaxID=2558931 RepID=UPI00142241D2|nr:cation transporter [Rhodocaloribacter litoris]QXD14739.1 cation transporter [Rhodocaloribacter litoris]GIV59175.1 MAG: hypothetical protein KatS3mg043_0264 [Rhodothermaceae bacterium]
MNTSRGRRRVLPGGLAAAVVALCCVVPLPGLIPAARPAVPAEAGLKVAVFSIESPFCSGCVAGLKATVGELEGVKEVAVDVENHRLIVTFDEAGRTVEALQQAIVEATSFKIRLIEVRKATG